MALNGDELCFPVHGTHEVVIIPARHLPEETEDILDLLTSEALPLAKWFDVARAYLSQNKEKQFLDVLREGTDDHTVQEIEQFFKAKPTFELIQFHCAYAAYYIHMFRKERDQVEKAKHQRDAIMRINAAKQLSSQEQLPWLASGFLALAKVCVCHLAACRTWMNQQHPAPGCDIPHGHRGLSVSRGVDRVKQTGRCNSLCVRHMKHVINIVHISRSACCMLMISYSDCRMAVVAVSG